MNTWDKKASKAAVPELLKASQQAHTAGPPANVTDAVAGPFVAAARWQREQLHTDEAIERVAQALHDHECSCGNLHNEEYGEDGTKYFTDKAQAAITALLGETP